MDSSDERVLMPATPHDAVNAMMSDMQSAAQGFLANFDDAATILTYFINEEQENCASIVPSMDQGSQANVQGSHDHPYSRIRTEPTTTTTTSMVNTGSYMNSSDSLRQMEIQMNNSPIGDSSHLMSHLTSHENYIAAPVTTYPANLLDTTGGDTCASDRPLFETSSDSRSHISETPPNSSIPNTSTKDLNLDNVTTLVNSVSKIDDHASINRASVANKSVKANSARPFFSTPVEPIVKIHSQSSGRSNTAQVTSKNPPSPTSVPMNTQTEIRTVVTFKVVDQILYQGNIIKETVLKDEEIIIKQGGNVTCSEIGSSNVFSSNSHSSQNSIASGALGDISTESSNKTVLSSLNENVFNNHREVTSTTFNKKLAVSEEGNVNRKDTPLLNATENKRRQPLDNVVVAKKSKVRDEKDLDSEEARRETATALLSLQGNQVLRGGKNNSINDTPETEPEFKPITKKARVMAKWVDRNYYPGIVAEPKGDGKWVVNFDDGGKRVIHESEIISVPYLCVGQRVMVTYSEGFCAKGVIKAHENVNGDIRYTIEYEEREKKIVADFGSCDVFLTADLASLLIGKQTKSPQSVFAGVDLNNIIPKTARVSKQTTSSEATSEAHDSETTNPVIKSVQPKREKRSANWSESNAIQEHSMCAKQNRSAKQAALPSASSSRSSSSSTSLRSIHSVSKTLPQAEIEKLLGPLPREGNELFKGIGFLLATAEGEDVTTNAGRSSTLFDVPYLIKQIELGGGRYLESFEEKQSAKDIRETVLIAYTYLRTPQYMQCLASCIPCVMHTWVVECCRRNQLVRRDDHLLPLGYSIVYNKLSSDKNVFKKCSTVFKGTKIMFAANKSMIAENWSPVVTAASATIVTTLPTHSGTATRKTANSIDFIVADSSCPQNIVTKAHQMKIPIVSTEYIVECLILGRKLPFDAHEKFRHDFKP